MPQQTDHRPASEVTQPPRQAERRRLWDRRSPTPRRSDPDRRHGERRASSARAAPERRAGPDRRQADRRDAPERRGTAARRRDAHRGATPIPFTAQEAVSLRAAFSARGPVDCPACGGNFTLGPSRRTDAGTERLVLCTRCGRAAVMRDAPAARVLVVSSVAPLRNLLHDMLASAGHEVIEVDDAGVGRRANEALPADVVLLDVVATGRVPASQLQRRLRARAPGARVVALAGRPSYSGVDPLEVVSGLGVLPTLRVPISRESLLGVVQDVRA